MPGDTYNYGEVELLADSKRVAKFEIKEDRSVADSQWEFSGILGLRVGPWMKDVLDIAAQIEASARKRADSLWDEHVRETAREIELG